jgi:hypothetical protein
LTADAPVGVGPNSALPGSPHLTVAVVLAGHVLLGRAAMTSARCLSMRRIRSATDRSRVWCSSASAVSYLEQVKKGLFVQLWGAKIRFRLQVRHVRRREPGFGTPQPKTRCASEKSPICRHDTNFGTPQGLIALVVRVSRWSEPVRAGVVVGTVAPVEGVGDSCASPRAGCSAASVGSAEADAG